MWVIGRFYFPFFSFVPHRGRPYTRASRLVSLEMKELGGDRQTTDAPDHRLVDNYLFDDSVSLSRVISAITIARTETDNARVSAAAVSRARGEVDPVVVPPNTRL